MIIIHCQVKPATKARNTTQRCSWRVWHNAMDNPPRKKTGTSSWVWLGCSTSETGETETQIGGVCTDVPKSQAAVSLLTEWYGMLWVWFSVVTVWFCLKSLMVGPSPAQLELRKNSMVNVGLTLWFLYTHPESCWVQGFRSWFLQGGETMWMHQIYQRLASAKFNLSLKESALSGIHQVWDLQNHNIDWWSVTFGDWMWLVTHSVSKLWLALYDPSAGCSLPFPVLSRANPVLLWCGSSCSVWTSKNSGSYGKQMLFPAWLEVYDLLHSEGQWF